MAGLKFDLLAEFELINAFQTALSPKTAIF